MPQTDFSDQIRQRLLDQMALRQVDRKKLAGTMDLDQSTLNRFLAGKIEKLGCQQLCLAAQLLGVSADYLLGLTDFPDRRRYRIEDLGLSPQAVQNLYSNQLDQHVVSLLLESPDFALVTHQISNFISGALSAGLAANNQLMDCVAAQLLSAGCPQGALDALTLKKATFQGELSEIQSNFLKAVKSLKTDMDQETSVQEITETQFNAIMEVAKPPKSGKSTGISPDALVDTILDSIVGTVSCAGSFSTQALDNLKDALRQFFKEGLYGNEPRGINE